ncbi:gas vesicle protein GvpQ [Niallia sp. XMNu-256]|uniref:gas vesicle protein GvpQ n=1 Tax=Niallia sp. XMNu-256 TaxID=3082444 RepID=UPI0030D43E06
MDKHVKKAAGKVAKTVIKHTPEPIKEKVKDAAAEKIKENVEGHIQNKGKEFTDKLEQGRKNFADKAHEKAGEAKQIAQDALLSAREKVGKVVEAGESFQRKVSSGDEDKSELKVKGVRNIKGTSNIKTSRDIKSATKIKSAENMKSSTEIKTMGS